MLKIYRKLLGFGLLFCFFFSFFGVNGVSQFADLDFVFNKNPFYDSNDIEFDESFNIRNQTYFNGTYPATYSFTDEVIGENGTDIGFVDEQGKARNSHIVRDLEGHSKILALNNREGASTQPLNNFTTDRVNGTIQLWIYISNVSETTLRIRLRGASSWGAYLGIGSGNEGFLSYYDGSWNQIVAISNQTWYHLRIDFECGAWGYEGLSEDKFFVYVNRVKYGEYDFLSSQDEVLQLGFVGGTWLYVDAIDYGWDAEWTEEYSFQEFSSPSEFNTSVAHYDKWVYTMVGDPDPNGWASVGNDAPINKNYLQIQDGPAPDHNVEVRLDFDDLEYCVVNFYFKTSMDGDEKVTLRIQDHTNLDVAWLAFNQTSLIDVSAGNYNISTIAEDNWFHLLIILDCEIDEYQIYLDHALVYVHPFDFAFPNNKVGRFRMYTQTDEETYKFQMDEVKIGEEGLHRNTFPIGEETNFLEVDKFEFALEGIDNTYDIGDSNPSGWTGIENNNGITQINLDLIDPDSHINDRMVQMAILGSQDSAGIEKTDFGLNETYIRINLGFELILGDGVGSKIYFNFTTDDTLISQLIFNYTDMSMYYNNGSIELMRSSFALNKYYEMNLFIDYNLDFVILDFSVNKDFKTSYSFDLIEEDKTGVEEISIELIYYSGAGSHVIGLDYIGVYAEGVPQTTEYGWITVDLDKESWSPQIHNILEKTAEGYIHFGVSAGEYLVGVSWTSLTTIRNYSGVLGRDNVYDGGGNKTDPRLVLTVKAHFNLSSLTIEGIKLVQGVNEYFPELTNGGIKKNESYFYVDSNNKLQFRHVADDAGAEFIQASFDISDRSSNSSTIGWKSLRNDNSLGYFRVQFETTSNLYQIAPYSKTSRFILPEEETIDKFVILITDGSLSITGLTTGFVSDISILYSTDILVTVVTLNLVGALIPLMMILVPTLAISERYGKNLIIPLFLLFTIILGAVGTIPLWLLFIVLISSSLFIFSRRKVEVGF